jgi:hypothetical protein
LPEKARSPTDWNQSHHGVSAAAAVARCYRGLRQDKWGFSVGGDATVDWGGLEAAAEAMTPQQLIELIARPTWRSLLELRRIAGWTRQLRRLIGSIRPEYLDHIVVFGDAHLRQILAAYTGYYNELERICRWTRIRRTVGPFNGSVTSPRGRFSADFIINIAGI